MLLIVEKSKEGIDSDKQIYSVFSTHSRMPNAIQYAVKLPHANGRYP